MVPAPFKPLHVRLSSSASIASAIVPSSKAASTRCSSGRPFSSTSLALKGSFRAALLVATTDHTGLIFMISARRKASSPNRLSAGPMISLSIVSTSLSTDEYPIG
jgi:hypothetical protein